jgi:FkbM family methyltransferase
MYLDTDESQQRQIYWTGIYDRRSIETLAEALPDGGVLMDIGAGVGSICLFVAKACTKLGKSVKVYAFEPMGLNHDRLLRNVGLNALAEDVSCHRLALGAEKGTLDLCYGGGAGSAGVVRTGPGIPSLAGERQETVPVDTLDDWVAAAALARLDVIKVDIEGAEPLMFRGAMTTIERFRPVILAEFNHWWAEHHGLSIAAECFEPLWDLGYRTYRWDTRLGYWVRVHCRPAPGPAMEDTLWMPPGREPGGG